MENKMRKGFTLVEVVIALLIVGILGVVVYGNISRFLTDRKCVSNGYVVASKNGFTRYCAKVENGNTIVIHVDSIR